jgi:hypothetical protein
MLCHDFGINTWYLPHNAVVMFTALTSTSMYSNTFLHSGYLKICKPCMGGQPLVNSLLLFLSIKVYLCQAIKRLILLCINYYLNKNEYSNYHLTDRTLFFKTGRMSV